MAALDQHLRAAAGEGLLDFLVQLREGDDVGVRLLLRPVKGAELTIHIAHVGVVDVPVHDVGDDLVAAPVEIRRLGQLPPPVSERAELFERQGIKALRLGGVDAPAGPDFLEQLVQ